MRRKINFVGGEPLLVSDLPALLAHAKREGFTTSITTNASLLSRRLDEIAEHTDWIGISIDSFDPQASIRLGRHTRWRPVDYLGAIARVRDRGIRLKINTVVSCVNCDEDMRRPIAAIAPERWKVLRFLLVEGANDRQAELRPSDIEFRSFAHRHR